MIAIPRYTPLVTLLAVGYSFFLATRVARARIKFHVALPATACHPEFDRIFRVHVNTLEWMPTSSRTDAVRLQDIETASMEYDGVMRRALRYGGTTAAILAAALVTAALWIRDERAAVIAVVVLGFVIGAQVLGKALGNEVNRRK